MSNSKGDGSKMFDPETNGLTVDAEFPALHLIVAEAAALAPVLEEAREMQWTVPPRRMPTEDTAQRADGPHSDPTADTASDDRRLALSAQIKASDRIMRDAAIAVRAARRGLEMRIAEWGADHA